MQREKGLLRRTDMYCHHKAQLVII